MCICKVLRLTCQYICVHIHILCIHTYIYIYVFVFKHICHIQTHIYVFTYIMVYIHVYIYEWAVILCFGWHTSTQVEVCRLQISTHTYICVYIYHGVHTRVYIWMSSLQNTGLFYRALLQKRLIFLNIGLSFIICFGWHVWGGYDE